MNKENLIDEAVEAAAFITNEEGYDVAVLRRVIANEVEHGRPTLLTDDEWQSLVNLVNAAPEMLAALAVAETALNAYSGGESSDLEQIRNAIKQATK